MLPFYRSDNITIDCKNFNSNIVLLLAHQKIFPTSSFFPHNFKSEDLFNKNSTLLSFNKWSFTIFVFCFFILFGDKQLFFNGMIF